MARLQHHSSVIMWDINNEGENLMSWGMPIKLPDLFEEYKHFYIDTLTPIMKESGVDLTANFMDTSPSHGVLSYEPFQRRSIFPPNRNFGDYHWYYLEEDCEVDATHKNFRFVTETGFQSESSFIDYADITMPQDWSEKSSFLRLHNVNNAGHDKMVEQSRRHYKVPKAKSGDAKSFSYYTWLSQIQ